MELEPQNNCKFEFEYNTHFSNYRLCDFMGSNQRPGLKCDCGKLYNLDVYTQVRQLYTITISLFYPSREWQARKGTHERTRSHLAPSIPIRNHAPKSCTNPTTSSPATILMSDFSIDCAIYLFHLFMTRSALISRLSSFISKFL